MSPLTSYIKCVTTSLDDDVSKLKWSSIKSILFSLLCLLCVDPSGFQEIEENVFLFSERKLSSGSSHKKKKKSSGSIVCLIMTFHDDESSFNQSCKQKLCLILHWNHKIYLWYPPQLIIFFSSIMTKCHVSTYASCKINEYHYNMVECVCKQPNPSHLLLF